MADTPVVPAITFGSTPSPSPTPTPSSSPSPAPAPAPDQTPSVVPDGTFEFQFEDGDEPQKFDFTADEPKGGSQEDSTTPLRLQDLKADLADKPEVYKKLKEPLGRLSRFEKAFKTPEDAASHLERLNSLAEGLDALDANGVPLPPLDAIEREMGEWSTILMAFESGDSATIDRWIDDNPNALKNIGPRYLAKWAKQDATGWSKYFGGLMMRQVMRQDTTGHSFLTRFNDLWQVPGVGDNPQAQAILSKIGEEINGWHQAANAQTDSKPEVPKEILEREQSVKQKERQLFIRALDTKVTDIKSDFVEKGLSTILKGLSVGKDARNTYKETAINEFNRLVRADKDFQSKMKDMLEAGQDEKFLGLLKAIAKKYTPEVMKAVYRKHNIGPSKSSVKSEAASRGEAGAGGSTAGAAKYTGKFVNGGPDPTTIDFTRMRAEFGDKAQDKIADHYCYIKGVKGLMYW